MRSLSLFCLLLTAIGAAFAPLMTAQLSGDPSQLTATSHLRQASGFLANNGRIIDSDGRSRSDIAFSAALGGMDLFFSAAGFSYVMSARQGEFWEADFTSDGQNLAAPAAEYKVHRTDLLMIGADDNVRIEAEGQQLGRYNFYGGKAARGIIGLPAFERLRYREIYPGIDLLVFILADGLKYEFHVQPGADPSRIRFQLRGASGLDLSPAGGLRIATSLGNIEEQAPYAFQPALSAAAQSDDTVACRVIIRKGEVSFDLGEYNAQRKLVIDPYVQWRMFVGGSREEVGRGIDSDIDNSLYATGYTESLDFPANVGTTTLQGNVDGYVAKYRSDGSFQWATYLGGADADRPVAIDVHPGGISLTGSTRSADFPVNVDPLVKSSLEDVFVASLRKDGTLDWAGFLGGGGVDFGIGVATDSDAALLIVGTTNSSDFPATVEQTAIGGNYDGFAAKYNADGSRQWVSYVGGSGVDQGYGIAMLDRDIVIVGQTNSNDFYATVGATTLAGDYDGYAIRLNSDGSRRWGTLLGGGALDGAQDVAIAANDDILIAGFTASADFGATIGKICLSSEDVFISRLRSSGTQIWRTLYGGSSGEPNGATIGLKYGPSIRIDDDGDIVIGGTSSSPDLPALVGQWAIGGAEDLFVAKFCSEGGILWSSYCGGSAKERGFGLALDSQGAIFLGGWTESSDFPATQGRSNLSGAADAVLARFDAGDTCAAALTVLPAGPVEFCEGRNARLEAIFQDCYPVDNLEWFDPEGRRIAQSASLLVSESGIYTVRAPGPCGCELRGSVEVRVFRAPVINLVRDTVYCRGQRAVQLAARVESDADALEFEWTPAEGLSNPSSATPFALPDQDTRYELVVRDNRGCSASAFVDVRVDVAPDLRTISPLRACRGERAQLEARSTTEGVSYQWEPITGLSDPTSATPEFIVSTNRKYYVRAVSPGGCSTLDSVTVRVRDAELQVSDGELDFGSLSGCDDFGERRLTLYNKGSEDIDIDRAAIDGADFILTDLPAPPVRIRAGDSLVLTVRFSPSRTGLRRSALQIEGAPCELRATIDLRGEKAELLLSTDRNAIDFGSLLLCENAVTEATLRVRNEGSDELSIDELITSPPFDIVEPATPVKLAPGGDVTIRLRYSAEADESVDDLLIVYSAADCSSRVAINLRGRGVAAIAAAAQADIDLGLFGGCDAARDTLVIVENRGDTALRFVNALPAADIALLRPPLALLAPGARDSIPLRFTPSVNGVTNASLRLNYEPCAATVDFDLRGDWQGLVIDVPDTLDFGVLLSCGADDARTLSLRITNRSAASGDLTIDSSAVAGPFSAAIDKGRQLPRDEEQVFELRFAPSADGLFEETLVLFIEPCGIRREVLLRGARRRLTFAAQSLDLGESDINTVTTGTLVFRNETEAEVVIDDIEGIDPPFELVETNPALPARLGPDQIIELRLSYTARPGTQRDTLQLVGTVPCSFGADGFLTGAGREIPPPALTLVRIPALEFSVHDRNVRIPVLLDSTADLEPDQEWRFETEIEFNASVFNPLRTDGSRMLTSINGGQHLVRLEKTLAGTPRAGDTLAVIIGDALLGNEARSPINLLSFDWLNTDVRVEHTDGLLSLTELCERGDGLRLLDYRGGFGIALLHPNPGGSEVTIVVSTVERTENVLSIYAVNGERQWQHRWIPASAGVGSAGVLQRKEFRLSGLLARGLYYVELRSAARRDVQRLLIVE